MSSKRKTLLNFLVIIVLMAVSAYIVYPSNQGITIQKYGINYYNDLKFHLGLDLQGGTHLVYQSNLDQIADADKESAMEGVRDVIEMRVNAYGVSEPIVQTSKGDRLIVELAGVKDVNEAIAMIGETPLLEFKEEMTEEEKSAIRAQFEGSNIPEQYMSMLFYNTTELNGSNLERANIYYDANTYEPEVQLVFDDEGKQFFSDITSRNVGRKVAIFLDNVPISIPTVNEPITDGKAIISGDFTIEEAKLLAQRLNAGALPVPIELISQQTVDASLGQDSVEKSLTAGIIGFALLCLFMIVYYRLLGVLAVIALIAYALISLSVFKLIPITLTLSGIAGFILSIGMAVDANVLIFERIREELKKGKTISIAIEEGFARAWSSIFDSNLSTLITCFILAYFGTSIIEGFAITLGLGVVLSMFSAIFITKTFLKVVTSIKRFQKPWFFGVKNNK
ncbi:MAG: protein translocase subunit SecD [Candidatus Pacebacteria bacterium]|nr:protein translocase subunit SecD [Candidatus Paceibacterota bacterium]